MPAFSARPPNTLYQFSPYGSLKPMKPTVFTPFFTMCLISAPAIRSSFCVVLNTQRFFASSGSTTDDVPTVAITGTLASAMMSRIASALGVVDGPIIASMLFSWISFLMFCTARVVSPPSSSWMYSTVASPIFFGQQLAGVLLRNADRGRGTGRGHHEADLDLRRRHESRWRTNDRARHRHDASTKVSSVAEVDHANCAGGVSRRPRPLEIVPAEPAGDVDRLRR